MSDDLKARLRALVIMDEVGSNNPLGREAQAMARDWCTFCEDIGMTVDTHQAIAERINTERDGLVDKAEAWDANSASIKHATETERERCAKIVESSEIRSLAYGGTRPIFGRTQLAAAIRATT